MGTNLTRKREPEKQTTRETSNKACTRYRLLAVLKAGPILTPEEAEIINRTVMEAREAYGFDE